MLVVLALHPRAPAPPFLLLAIGAPAASAWSRRGGRCRGRRHHHVVRRQVERGEPSCQGIFPFRPIGQLEAQLHLEVRQMLVFLAFEDDVDAPSHSAEARGAARPVQVCLFFHRDVQIHDDVNLLDIHAAREQVCATQDSVLEALQACKSLRADGLVHLAAARRCRDSGLAQHLGDLHRAVGVVAEDECLPIGSRRQDVEEGREFLPHMMPLNHAPEVQHALEHRALQVVLTVIHAAARASLQRLAILALLHSGSAQKHLVRELAGHRASKRQGLFLHMHEECLRGQDQRRGERRRQRDEAHVLVVCQLRDGSDVLPEARVQ
mmetsp:Transcript_10859/g.32194  ORF Transcript_10859/g.32194 Transcript_10859/m.32194 type:complete len:322 (-) Transcript_10859:470-1435(-)